MNTNKIANVLTKAIINNSSRTFATSQQLQANFSYKIENKCDLHRLDTAPSLDVECSKDDAMKFYLQMQNIRRLETTAGNLYKAKQIRGFCHLYSGQEAVCVGMKASLEEGDSVITAYRAHGWTYIMGVPLLGVLAELTGRSSGCAKGKGGSMHMYANQGQVFEAYNMAKLWNLPCIFVCENNGYAMGTSVNRGSASTDFYTRGDYVPGIRVDGMDVLGVREATRFARDFALNNGPIVMEMVTYRYSGHSMSDPGTSYRKREEVQEVRQKKDPITTFAAKLVEHGVATQEELKAIDDQVRVDMTEVERRALSDPEIDVGEMYNDIIYKPEDDFKVRGCDNFTYVVGK